MPKEPTSGQTKPPKPPKPPGRREQVAALPFRCAPDLQILLVSSLETRRWIVPKGWPMKGRTASETAAQEAFEEAGVKGDIAAQPVGVYTYDKRKKNGAVLRCDVEVFPLEVRKQAASWPEKALRTQRWCSWREAAELVDDAELGDLIRVFAAAPLRSGADPT
jgi:8-oxo-dGTP pyrophosphatase MutT (NUDIX family)